MSEFELSYPNSFSKKGAKMTKEEKINFVKENKEKYPHINEKYEKGILTLDRAVRQLKGWKQIEKRNRTQKVLKKEELNLNRKYKVIYADPPWDYGINSRTGFGGDAGVHYTVMSLQEICQLPVEEISEKNSILFLWTTAPFLFKSQEVFKAWGFEYKSNFVWDKVQHNMGWYNSVRHEHLLVCTKGSGNTPEVKKLYDSVQEFNFKVEYDFTEEIEKIDSIYHIKKSEIHSAKPEKFYEIIEYLYPSASKIELFARQPRKGWDSWGNQVKE
jgi:N6-adenosine-specific RNA methylase IME4